MSVVNQYNDQAITGIVVALPEELKTLTALKLSQGQQHQISPNLWVAYSGAGFANAERASQRLIEAGVSRLISWGCAAALDPALKAGDLVIADSLQFHEQDWLIESDWLAQIKSKLTGHIEFRTGPMLHSDELVTSRVHKQQLFAKSHALALDMESAAVVKTARESGLPALILRSIADTADFDLPPAVAHSLNAQGQVELTKLLMHLLKQPSQLPQLIKLGRYFKAAQTTLSQLLPYL